MCSVSLFPLTQIRADLELPPHWAGRRPGLHRDCLSECGSRVWVAHCASIGQVPSVMAGQQSCGCPLSLQWSGLPQPQWSQGHLISTAKSKVGNLVRLRLPKLKVPPAPLKSHHQPPRVLLRDLCMAPALPGPHTYFSPTCRCSPPRLLSTNQSNSFHPPSFTNFSLSAH